jgi:hypothetical protein
MYVITASDYMTIGEFRQQLLVAQLLSKHEGIVPIELSPPPPRRNDDDPDPFLEDLIEHMTKPVHLPVVAGV